MKMHDHLLNEVDGVDHVPLMLLVLTELGTELPVGVAGSFDPDPDPDDTNTADVAVTVMDDRQGRVRHTAGRGRAPRFAHRPDGRAAVPSPGQTGAAHRT